MDTKLILKQAREAIKTKDYDTSLKLCKNILRKENDNYMAYIFLGVSLLELGENSKALNAFQAAVKANPSNILGWNGLVNYYERVGSNETKTDLINAYIKLLNIETETDKLLSLSKKLQDLSDDSNSRDIISALYLLMKSGKCASVAKLAKSIVDILEKTKEGSEDLLSIYEDTLKVLSNDQQSPEHYDNFLKLLYKANKREEIQNYVAHLNSTFPSHLICAKWLCKLFYESYIEQSILTETKEKILNYSNLVRDTETVTSSLAKSVILLEDNDLVQAKEVLEQVVPRSLQALYLLLKCYLKLYLIEEGLEVAKKFYDLLECSKNVTPELKNASYILIIEALSKSDNEQDLRQTLQLYEASKLSSSIYDVIQAHISLNNFVEARLLLRSNQENQVRNKLLTSQLLYKEGNVSEALATLQNENVTSGEWWLQKGMLLWHLEQFEQSLVSYLKATKLQPLNYRCFLLLGNYYKKFNDFDKARRCYEKCFKLNRKCSEAGIELSRIYRNLKNWDSNINLLQALTCEVINKRNLWAWMQLGLHYLEQYDYDMAILNLRFVVRIEENNIKCWESLADAYVAKGAYNSALRCYEKTLTLSEGSVYPMLQMALIKRILGEFEEAKTDFEKILSQDSLYTPALKGIAETCLLQADAMFKEQRLGTCRDHLQNAANYLITGLRERNELACLWKLLGDSCLLVTKLPEQYCCLLLLTSFVEDKEIPGNSVLEKNNLFILATKCFYKCLSLNKESIPVWHDLSLSYLSHALGLENQDLYDQLMDKARSIAHHCCVEDPNSWQHWNLLGNIALYLKEPNFKLAQHSFVKAVTADNNSAISWSNLGTLYSLLEDYKLANEAYSQAQRADPNYVNSWIGQALLAESLAHVDAMDLFRHSTQLGFHKQGALGYAHWVCQTLKRFPTDTNIYAIHNMHAIPVACDAVLWYTEYNPMNAAAWNMLGVLRERLGLKMGALEAFKTAFRLTTEKSKDAAAVNYGRLLCKVGRYSEAITVYSNVKYATLESCCGLALTLFKDKQYKTSYEMYDSTLTWLSDDPHSQSNILIALASMAYLCDDLEAAKTILFQSMQVKNTSHWTFYVTLALGLLQNDLNLAQLVLKEMDKFKDDLQSLDCFLNLLSYFYILKEDGVKCIREVSKLVHRHPDKPVVWTTLAKVLIRLRSSPAHGAQIPLRFGNNRVEVLCLVSLSYFNCGKFKEALVMAQKAVHCDPIRAENWMILITILTKTEKIPLRTITSMSTLAENFVTESNSSLSNWIQSIRCRWSVNKL